MLLLNQISVSGVYAVTSEVHIPTRAAKSIVRNKTAVSDSPNPIEGTGGEGGSVVGGGVGGESVSWLTWVRVKYWDLESGMVTGDMLKKMGREMNKMMRPRAGRPRWRG